MLQHRKENDIVVKYKIKHREMQCLILQIIPQKSCRALTHDITFDSKWCGEAETDQGQLLSGRGLGRLSWQGRRH